MILSYPKLPERPRRIVSLVPSQTELLHYLGLEDETIGITKFCVHPATWFQTKTRIGGTKALDLDKIFSLQPDLIIANKEENEKNQVEVLADKFPVWVTDVNNFTDAIQMIKDIGELTRTSQRTSALVTAIHASFAQLLPSESIQVAYLIWRDPYMTVGGDTFIHDMLLKCGMHNVFGNKIRYPQVNLNDLQHSGCEVLLLSSEPYPFAEKHIAELQELLPGVKILLVDGEMFSWYGSRLLAAPAYFKTLSPGVIAS